MRSPVFEIVRTVRHPRTTCHVRFKSPNTKKVWVTETYKQRASAINAIEAFVGPFYAYVEGNEVCIRNGEYVQVVAEIKDVEVLA